MTREYTFKIDILIYCSLFISRRQEAKVPLLIRLSHFLYVKTLDLVSNVLVETSLSVEQI